MALSMVTLVGQWVDPDGSRSAGQILVEPTGEAVGGHSIVPATPLRIPLVSGVVAQSMVSTAQVSGLQYVVTEQIDGQDTVTYVITPTPSRHDTATATAGVSTVLDAAIQSMDAGKLVVGAGIPIPSYVGAVVAGTSFGLVDSSGAPALTTAAVTAVEVGAIDLSTADRGASPATSPLYVLASTMGQPNGGATLDGGGHVPVSQLPPDTGDVNSVTATDATIVIAGTGSNPTIGVGAIPESKVTNLTGDLAAKYVKPGTGIPATDLTAAVQAELTSASTAVQSVNGHSGASVTVTAADTGAYVKPGSGVPSTDMTAAVQTSLGLANTALQQAAADARYLLASGAKVVNALANSIANLTGDGTTNDQPNLATLVSTLGTAYASDGHPRVIYCPAAVYSMRDNGTVWKSGVSLIGDGPGATRFMLSNPANPTNPTPLASYTGTFNGASTSTPLTDCTFANFEVDGSGVSLASYSTGAKALVLQYMVRARFHNLYLHGCGATGLGCDFLQDSIVSNVVANANGRLNNGSQPGGAGIGIGIGGWGTVERTTIIGCTAVGNGTHGIFVESQTGTTPRGVRIVGCHCEGNQHGISDWGADGLVVSGCVMVGNAQDGFNVSGSGVASTPGQGGMVTGCTIDRNTFDGVLVGDTVGKYTVRGNRISNNGRHGYNLSNTTQSSGWAMTECVISENDIFLNANCGIRINAVFTDGFVLNNRIRNNGTNAGATTDVRNGLAINAAANSPSIVGNRFWDNQGTKTQQYGIYVTNTGTIGAGTVQNNNMNGNSVGGYGNTGGSVTGGQWTQNAGAAPGSTSSAQTTLIDGAELVNGNLRYSGAMRSFTGTAQTPSATANTNGTAQTCSPGAGQQGFALFSMMRSVFGGTFNSETATLTVTATFSDNSTASATLTATSASTQVAASGTLLGLSKDGLYVKSLSFQLQSTIANSLVTATPALVAAQC